MYTVSNLAQIRHNLGAQPKLRLERQRRAAYSGIGQGRHSHASAGHRQVIIAEHLRRTVVTTHPLESRRTYRAVTKFYRTDLTRGKKFHVSQIFNI